VGMIYFPVVLTIKLCPSITINGTEANNPKVNQNKIIVTTACLLSTSILGFDLISFENNLITKAKIK
jgi:hypothetical protein